MVNTVTLYRSPVRLVKHAFEETDVYSAQAINRARKKLMAEISLSGDEIVIDDVSYSRNDASTLLDGITEEDWKVHSVIYAHKGLLDFLEKEEFSDEELKRADAYLYNQKFVHAVSPYFAHAFNAVSGRLLKEEAFDLLAKLLNYGGYILPEHSDEAYQRFRTWFDELNYTLRNLSWEKFVADESILHFAFSNPWQRFINKLPSSFNTLRDETVLQLISIVLRFQHKATWDYLHQVLVQLKGLETSETNRSEVDRIDKVIYQNTLIESGRKTKSRKIGAPWRVLWWAIWVAFTLYRANTCNESDRTKFDKITFEESQKLQQETSAARTTEQKNEKAVLAFADSLSQNKQLTVQPLPEPPKTGSQPFGGFADLPSTTGPCTITVTNKTPYNCVLIYFDGPSQLGSVHQGSLSHTTSVYIKKGEAYSFKTEPSVGSLHFLFGEEWGRLANQAELSVPNYYQYTQNPSIFFFEFFKPAKPLFQKYLHTGIHLEYASDETSNKDYIYLNKPDKEANAYSAELILTEKSSQFFVQARGGLAAKEDRVPELSF